MILTGNLKENMNQGESFRNKMSMVFRDLRADFDVSTVYTSKEKLEELKRVHVDILEQVSSLAVIAPGTNGLVTGSRGTGKSHLLLLTRDRINCTNSSFCVYINLKEHLKIDGNFFVNERFYTWIILSQVVEQLETWFFTSNGEKNIVERIFSHFNKKNKQKLSEFEKLYLCIKDTIRLGESTFNSLDVDESYSENNEYVENESAGMKGSAQGANLEYKVAQTEKENTEITKAYKSYGIIDLKTLKNYIIKLKELLDLESIVFFYDEWSVLGEKNQRKLSELVRGLSTAPIFHWIAYIPYMTSLGVLEKTSDMPGSFELDQKYILEENRDVCINYFRQFANSRLENIFHTTEFNISSLLSNPSFELLVQASMGNTRDFGVILNYCWNYYREDYLSGKRYEKFNLKRHIHEAIKKLGKDKESNLSKSKSKYTKKLWLEVQRFVESKKYTHFCIEDNKDTVNFIDDIEFQELMYYRLLHLRKKGLPNKDAGGSRLDLYAYDVSIIFSKIFEVKAEDNKVQLVLDRDTIHDKIRRHIFKLADVMNEFRVEEGTQIICECKKIITSEMKLAWDLNQCIFCGKRLKL